MEKRKKIAIAGAASVLALVFLGQQAITAFDPGQDIQKSDINASIEEILLHKQEEGDNDAIANITIAVDSQAPEPALIGYVSCTDCTTPSTYRIVKPGQKISILYEYNLKNQSVPVFKQHAIDFIGASRVPKEERQGVLKSPRGYVNSGEKVKKIQIDLPNQDELTEWNPETVTEKIS